MSQTDYAEILADASADCGLDITGYQLSYIANQLTASLSHTMGVKGLEEESQRLKVTDVMVDAAKEAYWHEVHHGGGYSNECYRAALTAALAVQDKGKTEDDGITDEMLNEGQERLCQIASRTNFDDYIQAEIYKAMRAVDPTFKAVQS